MSISNLITQFISKISLEIQRKNIEKTFPISKIIELFGAQGKGADLLYLGDSITDRVSRYDTNKMSLGQIFINKIDHLYKADYISGTAYHPGVYYLILKAIQFSPKKPSTVILPINIRVFSPQWDWQPLHQCVEEISLLKKYIYLQDGAINHDLYGIDRKLTQKNFLKSKINCLDDDFTVVKEFIEVIKNKKYKKQKDLRYRKIFTFHYMYRLDENHRKLRFLKDIVNLMRDLGINLIIYITPVNYKTGIKYVGDSFVRAINNNIDIICRSLGEEIGSLNNDSLDKANSQKQVVLLKDLSFLFEPDLFLNQDDPTEHLNQDGREKLSDILSAVCLSVVSSQTYPVKAAEQVKH